MKKFENACVYVEGKGVIKTNVLFDGKITDIFDGSDKNKGADAEIIKIPDGAVVVPGFIDEHVHGGGGADAMDGDVNALKTISETLAKEGTTAFLATTMTQSVDNIKAALNAVKVFKDGQSRGENADGAEVLGVHLEGPFVSEKFKGAQPQEYILSPDANLLKDLNKESGNSIKIVTFAPEKEGAEEFIDYMKGVSIVPSIGHSSAKNNDVLNAIKRGAESVTHTYNAQSPLHHRDIGVVGSALLYDDLNCEIIADTIHVSVEAIKLLVKSKPKDKVTLITDAMRAKGLPDGESELGGQKVFVKNGEARLVDGTLAGSVLKMNIAVKNMVQKVGVDFETAIDFATANPAKNLRLFNERGSIKTGKRADFTVLDKDFNVLMTIVGGKVVFISK